jgi:hypothetical protein
MLSLFHRFFFFVFIILSAPFSLPPNPFFTSIHFVLPSFFVFLFLMIYNPKLIVDEKSVILFTIFSN